MKKLMAFVSVIVLALVVLTAGVSAAPVKSKNPDVKVTETAVKTPVNEPSTEKVLESRFLNMLNHNFVYGNDFDTVKGIVDNSVIALLDLRDGEDSSYIAENYVADFIFDMYGVKAENLDEINADFGMREGYVFILPRGYSTFSHDISSVEKNEDGSFTVVTNLKISDHDGVFEESSCTTLFVENENSAFGYNIIFSDIAETEETV